MTFTLKQLQEEQKPWVLHNFGEGQPYQPLLGLVEEIGELSGAVDQMEGCINDTDWSDASEETKDAIADIVVYMCDYASRIGVDMGDIESDLRAPRTHNVSPSSLEDGQGWEDIHVTILMMLQCIGSISHHHLKSEQGIRGTKEEHRADIVSTLKLLLHEITTLSNMLEIDFLDTVAQVWAEVKKRDWKKNSVSAHEDARA